jgi:tRNA threonylcarbamoyladenosine biosynthesis protein TsaB
MNVISIAIETSCRRGGLALGRGEELVARVDFDASARHATVLVTRLKELLTSQGLVPTDLTELYVSVGPGSFTGLRVGITVARTLAQAMPGLKCVAVPTPAAIAENARHLPWQRLAVILDAREGAFHASFFERRGEEIVPFLAPPGLFKAEEFLAAAPRPLLLTGEGLDYHHLAGPGVEIAPAELRLPTAEGVWRVGRILAKAGAFTPPAQVLPIYVRNPYASKS